MKGDWRLWLNRCERPVGVAVVYLGADYALHLLPNGLSDADRREWLERLVKVLNKACAEGAL